MADAKISALADGSPVQGTDLIAIARAGANYSIPVNEIAQLSGVIGAVDVLAATGTLSGNIPNANGALAGMYRVSISLICSVAGSAGEVSATISWNNGVTTSQLLTDYLSLSATGELTAEMGTFYMAAGQAVTYTTTVTGAAGSPQYALHIRMEYMG